MRVEAEELPDLSEGRLFGPRHQEVLDGLEAIILTEGFRDLTIGGLAQRLQCSRRTLYEIADSKTDLVLLVVDRLLRRVARKAHDALLAEDSTVGRIHAYLTDGLIELRQATVSFSADVAEVPEVHDLLAAHFRLANAVVASMVEQGIANGEFVPIEPKLAAEVFRAAVERLQNPDVQRELGLSLAEAFEQFFGLFADGLLLSNRHD